MEEVAEEFGAKAETIVFLDHFRELPDPRQRGKVLYPLDEILLLCLLAVLAGAETFVDIALFGQMNLNPAVGVGRAADFCDFSTKSCCVSRVRGVAASATDGPKGKLGRLSRGFAASVAGPSTALHFLPARAKKWRQRETPSRPEAPSHVNSLR